MASIAGTTVRCGQLLQMAWCSVVCVSVCWSRPWALQKRLNRSTCRLGGILLWVPRNRVWDWGYYDLIFDLISSELTNWVRCDWWQPWRTGPCARCAVKRLSSLWLRPITARWVQMKIDHTKWGQMRWDVTRWLKLTLLKTDDLHWTPWWRMIGYTFHCVRLTSYKLFRTHLLSRAILGGVAF